MSKHFIDLAVDVLVAALQSGKLPSYEPHDVATYLDIIYAQICSSTQNNRDNSEPTVIVH